MVGSCIYLFLKYFLKKDIFYIHLVQILSLIYHNWESILMIFIMAMVQMSYNNLHHMFVCIIWPLACFVSFYSVITIVFDFIHSFIYIVFLSLDNFIRAMLSWIRFFFLKFIRINQNPLFLKGQNWYSVSLLSLC
jgi:hypothetical protein